MAPQLVLSVMTLLAGQVEGGPAEAPPQVRGTKLEPAPPSPTPEGLGGLFAPTVLPPGALSAYGYVGAPEIGAGFRQGVAGVELEVRTRLQYFQLAFGAEALLRFRVFEQGPVEIAPVLGGGVVLNSGARWFDEDNFAALSLRILPGLIGTVKATETVTAIAALDLPFELGLSPAGTNRFSGLAGGGVEIALDESISVGALAQAGVERVKAPAWPDTWRFAWQVKFGLGFRLF